jgi:hypothetical protein
MGRGVESSRFQWMMIMWPMSAFLFEMFKYGNFGQVLSEISFAIQAF